VFMKTRFAISSWILGTDPFFGFWEVRKTSILRPVRLGLGAVDIVMGTSGLPSRRLVSPHALVCSGGDQIFAEWVCANMSGTMDFNER